MAGRFVRGGVQHNLLEQREEEAKKRLYGDTPKSKDDATSSATGWGTGGPAANVGRDGGSMMAAATSTTANQESGTSQKSGGQYSVEKTYGKDDTLNKYQEKLAEASVRLTMKATAKIIKEAEERQRYKDANGVNCLEPGCSHRSRDEQCFRVHCKTQHDVTVS